MKKSVLTLMLLVSSVAFAQTGVEAKQFIRYKMPESNYIVAFPGDVHVGDTKQMKTKGGIDFTSRSVSSTDNGTTFVFLYATYPNIQGKPELTELPPAEASACNGTFSPVRSYKMLGHNAAYFSVDCPKNGDNPHMILGVTAVDNGNDVVQLMVAFTEASEKGDADAALARGDKFWNSLEIK